MPKLTQAAERATWINVITDQAGVVTTAQARQHGQTRSRVAAHLAARRWQRVHRGVYATFLGPLPFWSRLWAALLAAGPGAVVSHETAAFLHGVCDLPGDVIHVTIPAANYVRADLDPRSTGVHVHRSRRRARLGVAHNRYGVPLTTVEHTVFDLVDAARSAEDALSWLYRVCNRRRSHPRRLAQELGERQNLQRRAMVAAALQEVAHGIQSALESEYLNRVERAHGLPTAQRQVRVVGSRAIWIDARYERQRTRVELDGRLGHSEEGRHRDRDRDNAGAVSGDVTLRYGHADVFGDPCDVAQQLVSVLTSRGWSGRPKRCGAHCTLQP